MIRMHGKNYFSTREVARHIKATPEEITAQYPFLTGVDVFWDGITEEHYITAPCVPVLQHAVEHARKFSIPVPRYLWQD